MQGPNSYWVRPFLIRIQEKLSVFCSYDQICDRVMGLCNSVFFKTKGETMNRYLRIAFVKGVSLVFILFYLCSFATASDAKYNRASLRGVQGVYVKVEGLTPEIEKDGLTETLIRRDVESKLQTAGIRIQSMEKWSDVMGSPHLYVNLNCLKLRETKEYIYSIHIAFRQNVYPEREPILILGATTWSVGGIIGITNRLDKIRDSLKSHLDEFIEAYLSVNPKR